MIDGAKTGTPNYDRADRDEGHYVNLAGDQYIGFVSKQLSCELIDEIHQKDTTLTEALKVAGEALDKAEKAIYGLAYTGTERIRALGGECDSPEKTGAIAFAKAGITESRAALERLRKP